LLQKQTNIELNPDAIFGEGSVNILQNEIVVHSSNHTFYLQVQHEIDKSLQKKKIIKDLEYQKGFLQSVEKKLSNERFVQNAKPEIIALEQKKKADAEAKIKVLEESLANL